MCLVLVFINCGVKKLIVLYVPSLGPTGLDVTHPIKRENVFYLKVDVGKYPTSDFHPEIVSYCVFSIADSNFYVHFYE